METLRTVGKKLCELCNQGNFEKAMETLYDPGVVEVEAVDMPGTDRETRGLDNIRRKSAEFMANTTVHASKVAGPYFFHPDRFACTMWLDCTAKDGPMKGRHQIEEVCVYTVKDGKITRAEYFYDMPGM